MKKILTTKRRKSPLHGQKGLFRRFITICVLAAVFVFVCGTLAGAAGFENTVVLGDSIATGYGLPQYSAQDKSAAPSFGNLIAQQGGEYLNLAADGATSAELLLSLSDEVTANAVSNAHSVIISIGGNDFLQPMLTALQTALFGNQDLFAALISGTLDADDPETAAALAGVLQSVMTAVSQTDPAETVSNLAQIAAAVRALNPDCEIYLLTIYNPFDGAAGFEGIESLDALAEEVLGEINGGIADIAANSANTAVIDVYSAFKGKAAEYTNIAFWDIHPNTAGHSVIYELLNETNENFADAMAGAKGSPDTGARGLAAVTAVLAAAGGAAFAARKRAK